MAEGKLYVIGTPIGNLKDITLRALETLEQIEVLVCEDSRVTSNLINHYIESGRMTNRPRYFVCNEFNESKVYPQIVEMVRSGFKVGLVSDAGMPAVSDPGYRAIRACLNENLAVEIIPGVSSLTTAVTLSGVGGELMLYAGFLPKKAGKRNKLLISIKETMEKTESMKAVFFISPHKLVRELEEIKAVLGGNVQAVLMRELTKKFEERTEDSLQGLIERYGKKVPKGEMVIVLGSGYKKERVSDQ